MSANFHIQTRAAPRDSQLRQASDISWQANARPGQVISLNPGFHAGQLQLFTSINLIGNGAEVDTITISSVSADQLIMVSDILAYSLQATGPGTVRLHNIRLQGRLEVQGPAYLTGENTCLSSQISGEISVSGILRHAPVGALVHKSGTLNASMAQIYGVYVAPSNGQQFSTVIGGLAANTYRGAILLTPGTPGKIIAASVRNYGGPITETLAGEGDQATVQILDELQIP